MDNRLMNLINGKQFRKVAASTLAIAIAFSSTISLSVQAAPPAANSKQAQAKQLRAPQRKAVAQRGCPDLSREELILVMPNENAEEDNLKEAFEDVHGTVIGSLGKGKYKVLIVKAEKGKLSETEKKLSKDTKNFKAVSVNKPIKGAYVPTDPLVGDAWHLGRLNCYKAYDLLKKIPPKYGYYNAIAILDSGCSWQGDTGIHNWGADVTGVHRDIYKKLKSEMGGFLGTGLFGSDVEDLDNEIEHWGNYAHTLSMGVYDNNGHGTRVASVAAGDENGKGSVGVLPGVQIYPIKIADGPMNAEIFTDEISLVSAMVCVIESRARVVNISYGGMNDMGSNKVLHELFKHFYFNKNGMIFNSAGNEGENMNFRDCNYINTVSALKRVPDEDVSKGASVMQLVDWDSTGGKWASNTGACVDFCAPGQGIPVTNPDGSTRYSGGTSFSSPMVAALAAMVLRVNPNLSNSEVQNILIRSCSGVKGRNSQFGFGLPDAEKAVRLAQRS